MKQTEIRLDVTYNTGNYTSARLGMTASIESGDGILQSYRKLKDDIDKAFNVLTGKEVEEEKEKPVIKRKIRIARKSRIFDAICQKLETAQDVEKEAVKIFNIYELSENLLFQLNMKFPDVDFVKLQNAWRPPEQPAEQLPEQSKEMQGEAPASVPEPAKEKINAQSQKAQTEEVGDKSPIDNLPSNPQPPLHVPEKKKVEVTDKIMIDKILKTFEKEEVTNFNPTWKKINDLYAINADAKKTLITLIKEIEKRKVAEAEFQKSKKQIANLKDTGKVPEKKEVKAGDKALIDNLLKLFEEAELERYEAIWQQINEMYFFEPEAKTALIKKVHDVKASKKLKIIHLTERKVDVTKPAVYLTTKSLIFNQLIDSVKKGKLSVEQICDWYDIEDEAFTKIKEAEQYFIDNQKNK